MKDYKIGIHSSITAIMAKQPIFNGGNYVSAVPSGNTCCRLSRSSPDMDTPPVIIRLLEEAGPLKLTCTCAGVCWSLLGVFLLACRPL
jgi:hypothetical protein